MRYFILFMLITFPVLDNAQEPLKYLKANNGSVYYEKVYTVPGKSAAELRQIIISNISKQRGLNLGQINDSTIFATISNYKLSMKGTFGLIGMDNVCLSNPMEANVRIDVREGKYRVTVNSIYFGNGLKVDFGGVIADLNCSAEDLLLKNSEIPLPKNRAKYNRAVLISNGFYDMFKLNENTNTDW